MAQPIRPKIPSTRVKENHHGVRREQRKPNIRGFKVYVGTWIGPDDPGNNPSTTSPASPPWLNGFGSLPGYEIWFAHGLDGELDMGGMYDLVTGSPVSGTVAFVMPAEWRITAPPVHAFAVELATDQWSMAVQTVDAVTGNVRIFWPIVANPIL